MLNVPVTFKIKRLVNSTSLISFFKLRYFSIEYNFSAEGGNRTHTPYGTRF